jgi:glucose dehydrogenase
MKRALVCVVAPGALIVAGLVSLSSLLAGQSSGQPSTKNGEWPAYTADVRGSKYSPLDQIDER